MQNGVHNRANQENVGYVEAVSSLKVNDEASLRVEHEILESDDRMVLWGKRLYADEVSCCCWEQTFCQIRISAVSVQLAPVFEYNSPQSFRAAGRVCTELPVCIFVACSLFWLTNNFNLTCFGSLSYASRCGPILKQSQWEQKKSLRFQLQWQFQALVNRTR